MDHICVMRRNLFIIFKNVSPTDGASTATSTVSCAHTFVWPIVSSSVSIFTIYQTRTFASRNLKFVTYLKFNLTIWSLHHLQTWEFWLRIEIFIENWNCPGKLQNILVVNQYYGQKWKFLLKNRTFVRKLKFWQKINIWVKN